MYEFGRQRYRKVLRKLEIVQIHIRRCPVRRCRPDQTTQYSVRHTQLLLGSDPDTAVRCESSEENLFQWSSLESARESGMVHHLATADANSWVQMTATRCDIM